MWHRMGIQVAERIERLTWLDRVSEPMQRVVSGILRGRKVKDALHGVWLGHALHPALVLAPAGAWLSAAVLDLVPGQEKAATTLVGVGTVAAAPAALSGANDWASLSAEQRRVGIVHWACNATAVALYASSLVARLRGRHRTGRVLGFAGFGLVGAGAYLGGHLGYVQAAAVNQAAPAMQRIPGGWNDIGAALDFTDGATAVRSVGDVPVLVYRDGAKFSVLLEQCAHQTGPLGEGDLVDAGGDRCVVCPWHGSTFRLADGSVVRGPAASNQPRLVARVRDGRVEVRTP